VILVHGNVEKAEPLHTFPQTSSFFLKQTLLFLTKENWGEKYDDKKFLTLKAMEVFPNKLLTLPR